jgi:riboflavin synthase
MFTGIVTDIGTVASVSALDQGVRLRIETAYDPATIAIGASISCAGVCLTVVTLPEAGSNARWFEVEAWEEALRLTTASAWRAGTRINLERALKIGDELGGHIVSGHVDGMATIAVREEEGEAVRFTLEAPRELAKFIAPKGSVALDGVADGQSHRGHPLRRAAHPALPRGDDLGRAQGGRPRQPRGRHHGPLCGPPGRGREGRALNPPPPGCTEASPATQRSKRSHGPWQACDCFRRSAWANDFSLP